MEAAVLAEKFMLVLETLRSNTGRDGSQHVVSTSPHVPVQLPSRKYLPVRPELTRDIDAV
jgi:hypothetical protein